MWWRVGLGWLAGVGGTCMGRECMQRLPGPFQLQGPADSHHWRLSLKAPKAALTRAVSSDEGRILRSAASAVPWSYDCPALVYIRPTATEARHSLVVR